MTPNPASVPTPPASKKSGKGCLIALAVVGGLFAVICLVSSIVFYRYSQSPDGQKVMTAMGKGVDMARKGMTAPGAAELRGAGCPQAIVIDSADIEGITEIFVDGGTHGKLGHEAMVLCQGNLLDDLPSCASLAPVYVEAAHPQHPFSVMVKKQGDNKPICQQKYSPSGEPMGSQR